MSVWRSLVAALAGGAFVADAATPAQWRSRSIYQVLTDRFARTDGSTTAICNTGDRAYCGGSYRGIIDKLDYIQGMGFSAIWISPVTKNFEGSTRSGTAYHGFWQQDLYDVNPHFGSASDLRALSDALHQRGMYLMVDVVTNHFGWPGNAQSVDYSKFRPFNSQNYFHPYCALQNDGNQDNTEDCWLGDSNVELVDVKTEDPFVIAEYQSWIRQLVSNYSIDGLRIDTVKHVDKAFWPDFSSAAGVYCIGEVFQGDPLYTFPYQSYMDGVLNFPLYYPLVRAFQSTSGNMGDLVTMINRGKNECKDSSLLGSFSENHDIPRFGSYTQDLSLARNVIAVTMLTDGIPIIYGGQEHLYRGGSDPSNREAVWLSGYSTSAPLYKMIGTLNQIRSRAIAVSADYLTYQNWIIYSDSSTMAIRKGFDGRQVISVFSNRGSSGGSYTLNLKSHGYPNGYEVLDVLSCTMATVDTSGTLPVPMAQGLPRVYFPTAQLTGSKICGR